MSLSEVSAVTGLMILLITTVVVFMGVEYYIGGKFIFGSTLKTNKIINNVFKMYGFKEYTGKIIKTLSTSGDVYMYKDTVVSYKYFDIVLRSNTIKIIDHDGNEIGSYTYNITNGTKLYITYNRVTKKTKLYTEQPNKFDVLVYYRYVPNFDNIDLTTGKIINVNEPIVSYELEIYETF